jgi:hypothetical protein
MGKINLAKHSRVEFIDDERSIGNSIIITLKQGWSFTRGFDNRVDGADTMKDALELVKNAVPFDGPFDP